MSMFKNKYRVVRDRYCGYEAQVKRWWWPFWKELDGINTWRSLEQAEAFCIRHAAGKDDVVKELGELP